MPKESRSDKHRETNCAWCTKRSTAIYKSDQWNRTRGRDAVGAAATWPKGVVSFPSPYAQLLESQLDQVWYLIGVDAYIVGCMKNRQINEEPLDGTDVTRPLRVAWRYWWGKAVRFSCDKKSLMKTVRFPFEKNHQRKWAANLSQQRKMRLYRIVGDRTDIAKRKRFDFRVTKITYESG